MQKHNIATERAIQRAKSADLRRQGGWTLVEVGAVIAIVIILAIVGFPSVKDSSSKAACLQPPASCSGSCPRPGS